MLYEHYWQNNTMLSCLNNLGINSSYPKKNDNIENNKTTSLPPINDLSFSPNTKIRKNISSYIVQYDSIDKDSNYVSTAPKGTTWSTKLNSSLFINHLRKSFANNSIHDRMTNMIRDNVLNQFKVDYDRMIVKINNERYKTIDDFKKKIEKYICFKYEPTYRLYYLIIMICTQSSFYDMYDIIDRIYTDKNSSDNIVISSEDSPVIELFTKDNKLDIVVKKGFKLINTQNPSQETTRTFKSLMYIRIKFSVEPNKAYEEGTIYDQETFHVNDNVSIFWFEK